jgi:hypothetical protein
VVLLAGLLIAATARAQSETVTVQIDACEAGAPAWDTQQMLGIVRVEIAPRQLAAGAGPDPSWLVVDACDPSRLLLRYQRGAEAVVQEMPLDDVPLELKPRVAALAIAELATGASAAAPAVPAPPAPAPPPRPRTTRRPMFDDELLPKPEPPARTETWFGMGAEGRVFFTEPGPSFGPRLTLALRYLQFGMIGLLGRQTVAAGDVTTGVAAGAIDLPLWRPKRAPGVSVAAGGEMGVTWAKGMLRSDPTKVARDDRAFFAAGLARLNWGGRVARNSYAQVAWSLGYARGLHAYAERKLAASTHGGFAAMTVTIAWAPD